MKSPMHDLAAYLARDDINYTVLADGSGVILDLSVGQVLTLNTTGAFLVQAIRDGCSEHRLLQHELTQRFDVDGTVAARDIDEFIAQLSAYIERSAIL